MSREEKKREEQARDGKGGQGEGSEETRGEETRKGVQVLQRASDCPPILVRWGWDP